MGKRQHQSDKMYVTSKEWNEFYGGHKKTKQNSEFRRLPYDCCSISLQPVETPYCSRKGHMFEQASIMPWLLRYKTNPITGKKMKLADLVKLHLHKNDAGKYHCPVLFKTFNENSHIVAVATTGHVYSYEAVRELNIKTKNWKDLITDAKFTRDDLITVQDPTSLEKFNMQKFHHLKHNKKLPDEDLRDRKDPKYHLKSVNAETSQTLSELYSGYKGDEMLRGINEKAGASKNGTTKVDKYNTSNRSTGVVAASFTSTAATPQTRSEVLARDSDEVRYAYVKTKAYARLRTNMGDVNLELHADIAPKACENFIGLCKKGYYDNTSFHRLIKNFIIQGGDPTATGTGGESLWGGTFADELAWNLSHSERGVLSMANSGADTNKSQFFITFRSCPHLDRKHTIFGKVVGGMATLSEFEKVAVDKKTQRPNQRVYIREATVFVDPFVEADEKLAEMRRQDAEDEKNSALEGERKKREEKKMTVYRQGVGQFVKLAPKQGGDADVAATAASAAASSGSSSMMVREPVVKQQKKKKNFSDFSGW